MPAAVSISQAIAFTNGNATRANVAAALSTTFASWNNAWGAVLPASTAGVPLDTAPRTVRNWFVASKALEPAVPVTGTVQQLQDVVNLVCRVLYATQAARAATPARITAADEAAILAAYNASWGTF